MRYPAAALLTSAVVAAVIVAVPGPAHAVVDGVDVRITQLPDEFEAGADARTVEVVVSTDRSVGDRRCEKVRWSMLLEVDGPGLDDVRVDRVEEGSFPVRVQAEGDTARVTDVRLDPGSLCPGRTVTARYQVAVGDGAAAGEVRFRAQAFTAGDVLLQEASASSRVEGADGADPSPSAGPSPGPSEDEPEETAPVDEPGPPPAARTDLSAGQVGGNSSLLGPGLIVGAVLVFLGVGLLMRIRLRNRGVKHHHHRRPAPPRTVY